MNQEKDNSVYVLGCPQEGGTVAVLCRSSGLTPGPAYCQTKRDAMKLKTRLANDPRGQNNHRAIEIINGLLIYRIEDETPIAWNDGDLWAYLTETQAKCVESQNFWNNF